MKGIWCYPTLPMANFNIQAACSFLSPLYLKYEKSQHPGSDFNGNGGGNTDLGAPVRNMSNGICTHARQHRVWGWVLTFWHEEDKVESMHAHCSKVFVKEGDTVPVGQVIGQIGRGGMNSKGEYYFLAHVHTEIRKRRGLAPDEWPSATMTPAKALEYIQETRYDPGIFLRDAGAARSEAELAAMLAAPAQPGGSVLAPPPPAIITPAQPGGSLTPPALTIPPNWINLKDAGNGGKPIPNLWASLQKQPDGSVEGWQVPEYKLMQRGLYVDE